MPEACQHFFKFSRIFAEKIQTADDMDFTDDPEVRDQPSIGGNSPFRWKCNNAVTIWRPAIHRKSPPRRRTCQKAQRKDAQSAPLPALENFCPRNIRMTRNETSVAGGSETLSTDRRRYFFLNFASFRVFLRAQFFRESSASCESREADPAVRQGGTRCPQRVAPATAGRLCRLIFAPSTIHQPSSRRAGRSNTTIATRS